MYRVTRTARRARAKRPDLTAADIEPLPRELPKLRRTITIVDHDFGERTHTIELFRSNRVDCYNVMVNGQRWKERIGWSKILANVRKGLPRVAAVRV